MWPGGQLREEKKGGRKKEGGKKQRHNIRKEQTFYSKRQGGGGSFMVWAGFAANGTTYIAFCRSRMDSNEYQELLADYLLPSAPLITSGDWTFMQDNAPIHRSASTKSWMEANGVKLLTWPALSPDLNPIENLWGWLVRKVYAHGRQFKSVSELKLAITETWSQIPIELMQSLVFSLKTRMINVIAAKGGPINY